MELVTMLGQISGQEDEQLIKTIEIRDLSMWTNKETINNLEKVLLTEDIYCTPERRSARAWLFGNLDSFRIYLSIIGPKSEHFKGDFPLSGSQAEHILKAIVNLVETFKKELRG